MLRWVSLVLLVGSLAWVATADVGVSACADALSGSARSDLRACSVRRWCCYSGCSSSPRCRCGAGECLPSGEQGDGYRPTLGGFTAPFVALIAWLIGGAFSVGVGLWTAQVLGNAVLSTAAARSETASRTATLASDTASFADKSAALDADAPLIVPPPYFWAAVAIVLLIVVAIITGVWLWWWIDRARRHGPNCVLCWPTTPVRPTPTSRAKQVATSRAWASLTDMGTTIVAGWRCSPWR